MGCEQKNSDFWIINKKRKTIKTPFPHFRRNFMTLCFSDMSNYNMFLKRQGESYKSAPANFYIWKWQNLCCNYTWISSDAYNWMKQVLSAAAIRYRCITFSVWCYTSISSAYKLCGLTDGCFQICQPFLWWMMKGIHTIAGKPNGIAGPKLIHAGIIIGKGRGNMVMGGNSNLMVSVTCSCPGCSISM